jgi:hypothetical protein
MRYEVTTALVPHEVVERSIAHFGPTGAGLQIVSQTPLAMVFQGGGGHVALTVKPGDPTTVELETREWDYVVKQFMTQISQRRYWWSRWWRRKHLTAPQAPEFTILNNASKSSETR